MKNITTPRTLADASFTTGYSSARIHEEESATYRGLRAVVCIAAAVLIGWLAAQGA